MMDREHERAVKPRVRAVYGLAGAGAAAVILGLVVFAAPQRADALPSYARQTGLACGSCHVSPAGGGPRTAFGKAFAANGHKVPSAAKPGQAAVHGGASSPPAVEIIAGQGGALSPPPAWPRRCNGWCPSRRY